MTWKQSRDPLYRGDSAEGVSLPAPKQAPRLCVMSCTWKDTGARHPISQQPRSASWRGSSRARAGGFTWGFRQNGLLQACAIVHAKSSYNYFVVPVRGMRSGPVLTKSCVLGNTLKNGKSTLLILPPYRRWTRLNYVVSSIGYLFLARCRDASASPRVLF